MSKLHCCTSFILLSQKMTKIQQISPEGLCKSGRLPCFLCKKWMVVIETELWYIMVDTFQPKPAYSVKKCSLMFFLTTSFPFVSFGSIPGLVIITILKIFLYFYALFSFLINIHEYANEIIYIIINSNSTLMSKLQCCTSFTFLSQKMTKLECFF